jgi:crotonobetainyl-CoA:carnitine CoA-transferase CaiB-like acyl-CoA transferase
LLERVHHPETEQRPYLRVPLRLDGKPTDTRRAAPTFDQHTRELLAEWLGLDEAALDELERSGAVGGTPDPEQLRAFYLAQAAKRR